ncbi:MAG: AbrB/MazE/SpoVT family DNA-binding domain-containing protein [Oceanipulchritudo sp.]
MTEKVTLGRRGVMTLPAKVRKRYGLRERDELLVEETAAGILLRPAVSMPVELYTEERIREFERDDAAIGNMLDELGIP